MRCDLGGLLTFNDHLNCRLVSPKSVRKCPTTSRRLVTTPSPFLSYLYLAGTVTTCSREAPTYLGTKGSQSSVRRVTHQATPSSTPSMPSFHLQDLLTRL